VTMSSAVAPALFVLLALPTAALPTAPSPTLEELAVEWGTDKQASYHGYTKLYSMLLDPLRNEVLNITEVGVAHGGSSIMWGKYFPRATYWGIESGGVTSRYGTEEVTKKLEKHLGTRGRIVWSKSTNARTIAAAGLAPGTQDVVVDDGDHRDSVMMRTLEVLWPLVRPGGFYFVEDLATGANGGETYPVKEVDGKLRPVVRRPGETPLVHDPHFWSAAVKEILQNNDVFFADTLVGNAKVESTWSNFEARAKARGSVYNLPNDRLNHNAHILAIRKRA